MKKKPAIIGTKERNLLHEHRDRRENYCRSWGDNQAGGLEKKIDEFGEGEIDLTKKRPALFNGGVADHDIRIKTSPARRSKARRERRRKEMPA